MADDRRLLDEYASIAEMAHAWKHHRSTIKYLIASRKLRPVARAGRTLLYDRQAQQTILDTLSVYDRRPQALELQRADESRAWQERVEAYTTQVDAERTKRQEVADAVMRLLSWRNEVLNPAIGGLTQEVAR